MDVIHDLFFLLGKNKLISKISMYQFLGTLCKLTHLPDVQGQGQQPRVPGFDGTGTAKRSYPASEVTGGWEEFRGGWKKSTPRGGGSWEEPTMPEARSGGCTGGPRGAIPY